MRMNLIIAMLMAGLPGTSVVALTGAFYYRLSLASQRDSLQEQLDSRVASLRRGLETAASDLAMTRAATGPLNAAGALGGDEFAGLLPTVTRAHAAMAARMLLRALRAPFTVDGHALEVDASIGVALFPAHGREAHVLLQHADIASMPPSR